MRTCTLIGPRESFRLALPSDRGSRGRVPHRPPNVNQTGNREGIIGDYIRINRLTNHIGKERMDAATWLADRGFGKPTVNAGAQAPGFGDFTIVIGDHDIMGNPINNMPRH